MWWLVFIRTNKGRKAKEKSFQESAQLTRKEEILFFVPFKRTKLTPVLDSTEQKQTSTYYKEKLNKLSHKVIKSTTVFFLSLPFSSIDQSHTCPRESHASRSRRKKKRWHMAYKTREKNNGKKIVVVEKKIEEEILMSFRLFVRSI